MKLLEIGFDVVKLKKQLEEQIKVCKIENKLELINLKFEDCYLSTLIPSCYGGKAYEELLRIFKVEFEDIDTMEVFEDIISKIEQEINELIKDLNEFLKVSINCEDGICLHLYPYYVSESFENWQIKEINNIICENNLNSSFGNYRGKNFLLLQDTPEELEKFGIVVDDIGVEYGFSDEYTSCSNCGNIIRTSPDSYSWTQDYYVGDCEILCNTCLNDNIENIIVTYHDDYKRALTHDMISENKLIELGYVKLNNEEYESGWYNHNDDPEKIAKNLWKNKYYNSVFYISNDEQFRTNFDVYYLPENKE